MTSKHAKREVLDELIAQSQSILDDLKVQCAQEEALLDRLIHQRGTLGSDEEEPRFERQNTLFAPDLSLSLPKQVENLLRSHDAPMRAADIARKLGEQGVQTKAEKGLLPVVLSALSRKKSTFYSVSRGIYGLVEWQNRNGEGPERA